jgi:hypothetical protein
MNDPLLPPSREYVSGIGVDLFDEDEDDNIDDDLLLDPRLHAAQGNAVFSAQGQMIYLATHGASASASMTGNLSVDRELAEQPEPAAVEEPANLLWAPIARLFMSPTRYNAEWLTHISDMNHERHECLRRGDLAGARWAVIRAHLYSLPLSWLLIPGRIIWHLLRHWSGL